MAQGKVNTQIGFFKNSKLVEFFFQLEASYCHIHLILRFCSQSISDGCAGGPTFQIMTTVQLKEKCIPWEFSQRLHYKVYQSSALNIQSIRRKRKMFKHFTVTVNVRSFILHSKDSKTSIGVSIPVAIDLYDRTLLPLVN